MKNSWVFPVVQSVHITGIALLVGAIVLTNLRVLGYALRSHSVSLVDGYLAPWTRGGLAIVVTTGVILFAADTPRYVSNPAFDIKIAFLLLALLLHFSTRNRAFTDTQARGLAVLSMALWTLVVLAGRAIADFDI